MSCSIEVAKCLMDLLFSSARLGVGRPIILEERCVMRVNFVPLVRESMLKQHMEKYRGGGVTVSRGNMKSF